eukprot:gene6269-6990_t
MEKSASLLLGSIMRLPPPTRLVNRTPPSIQPLLPTNLPNAIAASIIINLVISSLALILNFTEMFIIIRKKRIKLFERILLSLCLADILVSIFYPTQKTDQHYKTKEWYGLDRLGYLKKKLAEKNSNSTEIGMTNVARYTPSDTPSGTPMRHKIKPVETWEQHSLLNSKISNAYDSIQNLEELKLELDEPDKIIEQLSNGTKDQLQPFETSIVELELNIKDENSKLKEMEMLDKEEYETKVREKIRKEGEQAEDEKHYVWTDSTVCKVRSEGRIPFEIVGVDYAGPLLYKNKNRADLKAYSILYSCSLTRGLHLELLQSMICDEFIGSFIAVRGRPKKMISDDSRTYVAAAKIIDRIMKGGKAQGFLERQQMVCQFNLSRVSWWGGIFERMASLVKAALYKIVGPATLLSCKKSLSIL